MPILLIKHTHIHTFMHTCLNIKSAKQRELNTYESVGDLWNTKTSMSQARYGLGVVMVDDKIYAIGGWGIDGLTGANECYDPKTDIWTTLASMPTLRYGFAAVEYQGKIYCIGGALPPSGLYGSGSANSVANEVYDIATDSWSTRASSPSGGRYMQAAVVDGKIFVLDRHQYSSNLYMYDPIADIWTTKTGMPGALYIQPNAVFMVVVDDKLIIVDAENTMIYDPKTDTWREGTSCPLIIYDGAAGVTSDVYAPQRVYILGTGRPSGQSLSVMFTLIYDPAQDIWSTAKAIPTYRRDFGVAAVDDILYVIGGWIGDGWTRECLSVNEQYAPFGYTGTLPSVTSVPSTASANTSLETSDGPSKSESSITSSESDTSKAPSTDTNVKTSSTNIDTKPQSTTIETEIAADNNLHSSILSSSSDLVSDGSFDFNTLALIVFSLLTLTAISAVIVAVKKRNKFEVRKYE